MKASKEGKKTLFGHFTSWSSRWLRNALSFLGKYTGISLVLGGISSVLKSLFGGRGADKADGVAESKGKTQESPEGNGKGPENGSNQVKPQHKMTKGKTQESPPVVQKESEDKTLINIPSSATQAKQNEAVGLPIIHNYELAAFFLESLKEKRSTEEIISGIAKNHNSLRGVECTRGLMSYYNSSFPADI